jgi:LPS-assembly protein
VSRQTYLAAFAVLGAGFAAQAHAQNAPATPPSNPQQPPSPTVVTQTQQSGATTTTAEQAQEQPDVILRADRIIEDRNLEQVIAEGNVEVRVEDRVLMADRLVYDRAKGSMHASGRVQITQSDGSIQFADDIEADEEFANGFATRFSARLDANTTVTASAAVRSEDGSVNTMEQVIYTGCPICRENGGQPTWSLRARRMEQNTRTQMITYQDAVLEIRGVPVLYIPYFAHPDPTSERRSGLLTPDIGLSSKVGLNYEQPYYLVISPSEDITFRPVVYANVAPLMKVDYRRRFFSGFLQAEGSFTHEQDFDSDGDRFGDDTWRSHLYAAGAFAVNKQWRWGFGVERQSDDLYDQRYDIDGEDDIRGLYQSQPRQLLTQLYTVGQSPDFYFQGAALVFQGLRAGEDDAQLPRVAPTVFAERVFDFGDMGRVATDVSAVALFRDTPQTLPNGDVTMDSARITTSADWRSRYIMGPGIVVEPFALARGDAYRIDAGAPAGAENINRFLGLAGATATYPIIRRGETVDVIIEPVVMVAWGTEGANDDGIPNEDSLLFEADESNIFQPNAVTNYDLWEGGGRVAAGLSATARAHNGFEVTGMFGRRWREEADPAFNSVSNLSGEKSDYVASVKADFGQFFHTQARARLNDDFRLQRLDIDTRANIWRLRGDARYFKVEGSSANPAGDEGIVAGGTFTMTTNWSALYYQSRNIRDNRDVRTAVGIAYRDDCSYFALTYERSGAVDRTLGPSESIRFQFVLTGLGGVSDDRFD